MIKLQFNFVIGNVSDTDELSGYVRIRQYGLSILERKIEKLSSSYRPGNLDGKNFEEYDLKENKWSIPEHWGNKRLISLPSGHHIGKFLGMYHSNDNHFRNSK